MTQRPSSSKPRSARAGFKALLLLAACTFTLTAGGDCTTFNPQTGLDGSTVGGTITSPLVDIDHLDAPDLVTADGVGDTFRIEVRAEDANGDPMPNTEARVNVEYDETMLELVRVCGGQDVNDHNSAIIQECRPLVPSYHVFVNDGVMWFKFRALQEGETDVRFVYPGVVVAGFTGFDGPTPGPSQPEAGPVAGGYTEETTTHVVIGGAASDEDDDGVPDFEDDCPGTPEGAEVDEVGCSVEPPPPGADVVVINDINVFDSIGMKDANNVQLVQNLVGFTTTGSRNDGTVVMFDRGRGSNCAANEECGNVQLSTMRSTITDAGFTILDQNSTGGSITSIPANVKTLFLWMPEVTFTNAEINVLKAFAAEGGRIVFIGEHVGFYLAAGIAVQNAFLDAMGAQMTNTGGAVDCGFPFPQLPASSLRDHQVTDGMTGLRYSCSSVIDPGPSDFPLWFDQAGTQLLAGVAAVDTTPVVAALVPAAAVSLTSSVQAGVKATSTGN